MPSLARCAWYCRVARMSAIISRPPGRSTRTASLDGFLPARTPADVVDRQAGDDQIKAVVFKGQRRHVGRVQFDPIRYPLGDGVAPGGLGGIARLIDRFATGPPPRPGPWSGVERPAAAPHPGRTQVEDALVTPKAQPVEQFGPDHELAPKRGVEARACTGQQEHDRHERPHLAGEDWRSRRWRRSRPQRRRPNRGRQSHTNHAVEVAPVQSSGCPSSATKAENSRRFVCFQIVR